MFLYYHCLFLLNFIIVERLLLLLRDYYYYEEIFLDVQTNSLDLPSTSQQYK